MNKKLITAYIIFSVIVFLFCILWFAYRTINTRSGNREDARVFFDELEKSVTSAYLKGGGFDNPHFSSSMKTVFFQNDNLKALVVYSDTIEYLYATDSDYLVLKPGLANTWKNLPEYRYNRIVETKLSSPIAIPSVAELKMDGIYRIISRREVFPILRELLIALLSFIIITGILIILFPSLSKKISSVESMGVTQKPTTVDTSPAEELKGPAPAESVDEILPISEEKQPESNQGLYSPYSDLGWQEYLEERLNTELRRAASFDQDLVLLLACVSGLTKNDSLYRDLAKHVHEYFNFKDLCFEYGDSGFGVVIPNVDLDTGIEKVEDFKSRIDQQLSKEASRCHLSIGLSARNGRLISGHRIIKEAQSARKKAENDASGIIAFRVDPEKYRIYLASNGSR